MAKQLIGDTNGQLLAGGSTNNPVYGKGARGYGAAGGAVTGRESHVQFTEQNSGFAPAEDYRAAKFLPGLWRDLDRNGIPYVTEGGAIMGVAGVESADGSADNTASESAVFTHQVMPANAGVRQKLNYTDLDTDVAIDIDTFFSDTTGGGTNGSALATTGASRVITSVATATAHFVAGNKPLAYNPTHELSSAWEDVFTNQKFTHQATMKTEWLCMYPVSNGFMYGATTAVADTVDAISGPIVTRAKLGFSTIDNFTAASVIEGIQAGDSVMPNPWLPGTLISIEDFARLASANAGEVQNAVMGTLGIIAPATPSIADCIIYGNLHKVGKCFKRQSRAFVDNGSPNTIFGNDIYGSTYKFMVSPPGLGLPGSGTSGIEADQAAASKFAIDKATNTVGTFGLDVVFINFEIK